MLIKNLIDFDGFDWYIGGVAALCQKPNYSSLSHKGKGRAVNGFLYVVSGEIKCVFKDKTLNFNKDSFVYLPEGSMHEIFLSEDSVFRRIDFTITDGETGEKIIFSDAPEIIFEKAPRLIDDITRKLCDTFESHENGYIAKCISNICWLISEITSDAYIKSESVLDIALNYIRNNLSENFTIEYLAGLCNVSSAHFRRLFKARIGMTPIKYKNYLRVSKSKIMLRRSSLSISEISDYLGFENEYYFNRVFKETTGISPGAFRNNNN